MKKIEHVTTDDIFGDLGFTKAESEIFKDACIISDSVLKFIKKYNFPRSKAEDVFKLLMSVYCKTENWGNKNE